MKNPTVGEILVDWLKKHGYDGLFHSPECGCILENFMPCCEVDSHCEAGYKKPDLTGKYDFIIGPEKLKEVGK